MTLSDRQHRYVRAWASVLGAALLLLLLPGVALAQDLAETVTGVEKEVEKTTNQVEGTVKDTVKDTSEDAEETVSNTTKKISGGSGGSGGSGDSSGSGGSGGSSGSGGGGGGSTSGSKGGGGTGGSGGGTGTTVAGGGGGTAGAGGGGAGGLGAMTPTTAPGFSPASGRFQSFGPPPPSATVFNLLVPFPVILIEGIYGRRGAVVHRLTVQAPTGAGIEVRCLGRRCPGRVRRQRATAAAPRGQAAAMVAHRFKRFQRRFRAGTAIEIRVTMRGKIGKYTRFRVRRAKPPLRVDACVVGVARRPSVCPA